MEKLKPYIEKILTETLIPILYITEKDVTTFNEDPHEFIQDIYDYTRTLYMPRT